MGISIHYSGKLKKASDLPELIEEVKEIAEIYHWKYHLAEQVFPNNSFDSNPANDSIYGISFSPTNCEPVPLLFLADGKMSSFSNLQCFGDSKNEKEQEYLYMVAVKTQYAGEEIHKIIVGLLRYLNEKYLCDFKVTDEGCYWETKDEKLLHNTFARYTNLINQVSDSLEIFPKNEDESFEEYFKRILDRMNSKNKK